jgi:hypothetical protein
MKRLATLLLFSALAAPAWAGKTMTVSQLDEMLRSMQRDKKSDADIANALKQVELSEELTRETMNSLVQFVPGPLSTEQVYVLEALSADLTPPPSDLPATAAPDPAAQKAILARAATYVNNTYQKLPVFSGTRTTLRFQDNMEAVSNSSGIVGSGKDVVTDAGFSKKAAFIHYIRSATATATFEHGVERATADTDKIPWGANRMIAVQSQNLDLGFVFHEASQAGTLQWLRWELVGGKTAAIFSFTVPRKQSRLSLKVCCFPKIDQAGIATFYSSTSASALGGQGASGGGVSGNYQTTTEWHDFRAIAPYHGELFIDPVTGTVVRMIVQADLKPTDMVHQVDTRIDYAAVKIGASTVIAPVKSIINTVVVPGGESGSGMYTTRCTLFTSEYKDYILGAGTR